MFSIWGGSLAKEVDYSNYFPITEYYRRVVMPLNRKYKITGGDKMICPLHDDHDPSLSIIPNKTGVEVCHCFGCNYWGNVIKLHKRVMQRHKGKVLSTEEVRRDLCRTFNIKYETLPSEEAVSDDDDIRKEVAMVEAIGEKFDISDFKYLIIEGKKRKKGIGYFNALMMSMINEIKNS